jgi:hypothetical protein
MAISIVTRSYRTSELKDLVLYLEQNQETEMEIIAVCNINDLEIPSIIIILENSNRFEARITGINKARYDKVLLLDSDQIPELGLLTELDGSLDDMIIIPEKSLYNNITAKCLDDWRMRNENFAKNNNNPYIPVVPRMYKKTILLRAIKKIPNNIYKIISHEDSVLYYETFKITQNIAYSRKHIFNKDPDFITLMIKAFHYGKSSKAVDQLDLPPDIVCLLKKLDKNSLNVKALGIGKGYLVQTPRAFAYLLGRLINGNKNH